MRGFGIFVGAFLALIYNVTFAFAKFEQTTAPKVDNKVFGGMSDEEVEQLTKQMQSEYTSTIYKNIKKFDDGDKSSAVGGNGRYGGYGEAHISKGDAMVSHDGGSNAAEGAIELGALGSTGLSGDARIKKEEELMSQRTEELKEPVKVGKESFGFRNKTTGQLQKQSFEISAALYDAGSAHGGADDPHRVYGLKNEVRTETEKNAKIYANKTIQDATLAKGKQPNLDLLHKSFSKMEQDKYVMMASDAFAFKSARLGESDTTQSSERNTIAEYKQIAVDEYAKNPGNIAAAEKAIQGQLAKRVAERKVIGNESLCADGTIGNCAEKNKPSTGTPKEVSVDEMVDQIIAKVGGKTDGSSRAAIRKEIEHRFREGDGFGKKSLALEEVIQDVRLRSLSGVLDVQKLNEKYAQAKQALKPEKQSEITQYEQRLASNDCISFQGFCYVGAFAPEEEKKKREEENKKKDPKDIDPNEFQKVSGDPGAHFKDTREFIFSKFAYAYNRPLAEWDSILKGISADFSEATDQKLQGGTFAKGQDGKTRDGKLYKEFKDMYGYAMKEAENIQKNVDKSLIDRLKSAGATPEQIAKVQKNYGQNFDAKKLTHMQLFGQNKDRDAIMMDWRKGAGNKFLDPSVRQRPTARPALKNPLSNVQSGGSTPGVMSPI